MFKKTVLILSLALVALLFSFPSPSAAQQKAAAPEKPPAVRTLSFATLAPPGSTWMKVFEAWNREVRRRSNQTLQIRFYAGGVQGDEGEVIRKIRSGRIDGAAVTAVGLAQIHRPALVFQMPGILRGYEQLDAARAAITPEMNPMFAQAGFELMGWADVGISRVFSNKPVHTPADFAPLKPWVWRDDLVLPELFRVVKSNPVPLQLPEVLGALQTNRIDTLIATPVAAVALQWSSRVSHMLDLPLTIVIGGTVIGQKQWQSLTPEQRTILSETSTQFHALARKNLRSDEQKALATLKQRNITVVAPTEADKAAWLSVGKQVRERLVGQIADQALVDRVMQFSK
jgi:TRAP-type C4-dicarboxylate transport system substrate-binding protein